jgi:hypothetical protein
MNEEGECDGAGGLSVATPSTFAIRKCTFLNTNFARRPLLDLGLGAAVLALLLPADPQQRNLFDRFHLHRIASSTSVVLGFGGFGGRGFRRLLGLGLPLLLEGEHGRESGCCTKTDRKTGITEIESRDHLEPNLVSHENHAVLLYPLACSSTRYVLEFCSKMYIATSLCEII